MRRICSIIVVAMLLFSGFIGLMGSSISPELASSVEAAPGPFIINQNGFSYSMDYISDDEISQMKTVIGTRDPGTNYNVMIGENGTGLAPPTEEGWNNMAGMPAIRGIEGSYSLASQFDLSTDPCFPSVGNQLSQGSCSAWAMTYYSYGYLEARDNNWTDASTGNESHLMSPAWTYNKVNGGLDWGSWMYENAWIINDWGVSTLTAMPYNPGDCISWGNEDAWRNAPLHRAKQDYFIPYVGDPTVDTVKGIVSGNVPITFGIDAYEFDWSDNFIISALEYDSIDTNHAQTIVGYNDSITDDGDMGAFRVVNSWGLGSADNGYYWLTYEAFKEIGDAGELTLTYIEDEPDHVPTMLATWEFSTGPTRDAVVEIGVGGHESPEDSKQPWYFHNYFEDWERFPDFMCLDISEFQAHYDLGTRTFYLDYGDSSQTGVITSFHVEKYEAGYVEDSPSYISSKGSIVPRNTPGYVFTDLPLVHNLDKDTYHPTIQLAIDNADAGNTILAPPGTYNENVMVNKTLDLMGENMASTVIDAKGSGCAVLITVDWVNISGFTFTGGGSGQDDAGLKLENAQNCTVMNAIFTANNNGIYLNGCSNNLIYHNNFINNSYHARDKQNNTWDNGYPSGGNHWDNYTGVDAFSGPYQNLSNSDGIGDTPYQGIYNQITNVQVINETVLTTTGDVWIFNLGYTNLTDCTLWVDEGVFGWWCLDDYCSVDNATGEVTMTDGWPLWAGLNIQAWLNCTLTTMSAALDNYPLMKPMIDGRVQIDPFRINSNADFNLEHGVTDGDGSAGNPWIIESWDINGTGYGYCIYVGNTTEYFAIKDCNMYGAGDNPLGYWPYYLDSGVLLNNVVNGLVENNTLTRNDWCGAAVLDSTDNTLACNYVEDNWLGLYLDNADYNNIVGNDIQANRDSGMYIYESDNNNIIENTVMNSEWGIYVDSSEYNDIVENTCSQALLFEGITVVSYSAYNYIANNTCNNNTNHGIGLWESDDNVIWNNTCQGNDNFGVALWDSQRITVEANILEENLGAISIDNSTQIMALDNQIASNYNHGIFIEDSDLCTIDGNIMTDNGISINSDVLANWNTHTIPDTNTVSGRSVCYLKNQTGGAAPADAAQVILANCTGMLVNGQNNSNIEIGISLGFSSNNTVSDNIASHNNQHGIYLQLSDGIIIQNNTISSNQFDGLSLSGSNYCSMYENRISGNDCGIRLDNSSNNTIWNNDIFENQERGFTYPMAEAGCSDNSISHNGKKNMQSSQLTTGPEPPAYVLNLEGIKPAALDYQVVIQDVPVYLWEDGCGPTSMGMVMGYWDGAGFDNLVEGDASSQTTAVNNMISSQGNWDDYCLPLDNWPVKPDKSELPMGDEHDSDSIADFSMTSRSYYDNAYGWSWNKHSIPGYVGYVQHVAPEYKISLDDKEWGELTWDNFRAEIDANHPVFLVVDTDADGYTDHAVVAIGYGEEAGVPMYNCLDTWDMSYDHWYEFNEMQSGRSFGIFKGMFFDLEKSGYGFHLESSDGNQIHHNNIINNTIQSFDDGDNSWDNGYPSGGNYWSDYQVLDHAIIETNYGNITFQMYPDEIPITTENFISYVEADFYSDTLFHRVIDNFVIQGGGYYRDSGNLTLKTELYPPIPLETSPVRTHTDGAVSMAREADPDSATCQFFICDGPQPFLDDNYAVFGHVVEGMDVVRTIAALPKQSEGGLFDVPVDDVIINRISLVNITVADEYCGPNQDLEGGDGLGDIPYYGIANIDLSVDIVNETVLTTTGDVWNFNIGYTDIIYCTLWVNEGGAWWNLDAYCLVDYATGEVTMSDGWPLWTGLSIHAWLNYITPNIAQDNYPLMAPVDHNLESYAISLDEGWNLISLPLAPCHESIIQVLSGIDGKWDYILTYDAAIDNPWQSCNVIKPHQLNNLRELDTSMGIWINVTQQNVTLTVYGHAPATTSMELHAGWNLVGYPSLNTTMTIADAFWGTGANIVEICDTGQPYNLCEVGPTYIMQPGEGYWVHVPADTIWIVDW